MKALIDIGVNLASGRFAADLDAVVQRARGAGVVRMIVTGTGLACSRQAQALARRYGDCYATAGLHPHHASDYSSTLGSELRELGDDPRVVAVGECGLDFNRNFSSRSEQIRAFEAQLEIAVTLAKPVFLHQRDAHDDFIAILKNYLPALKGAVAHCFTGDAAQAHTCLEMGLMIGVTGWITDRRRGEALREAIRLIPLDRLMVETDAPYLLPHGLDEKPPQKGRNEPCLLPAVVASVARCMDLSPGEVARATTANACGFFDLGPLQPGPVSDSLTTDDTLMKPPAAG